MSSPPKPGLVYILAASHSGSTLTAMLLNSHPQICTAGELKISSLDNPASYRCSCRSYIHECAFWQDVSRRMREYGHEFDVVDARTHLEHRSGRYVNRLLRPLHRDPLQEFVRDALLGLSPQWRPFRSRWNERNRDLVRSVAAAAGASFVVDSSKTGVRLKYLRRIADLDVKVIRLVRDGRAVSLTYMDSDNYADAKTPALRGGGTGPTDRPHLSMEAAASRWLHSNRDAEAALRQIPDSDKIVMSYEQLCTDPAGTLSQVHEFLGVESNSDFTDFRASSHHVVGNGMRLDSSSEIVLDDRWKSVLSAQELRDFDRVAGHLNRKYGYE